MSLLIVMFFCGRSFAQNATPDTTSPAFLIVKAAQTGDVKLFSTLLASDSALINTKEPFMDEPLLVVAARKNQPEIVALLIKKGVAVNTTNRLGSNALHLAAFTGNYQLMEMLMAAGVDWKFRNQKGKTPVLYVSYGKNPGVFRLFLAKDKNILSEKTSDGASLLLMAANAGDTEGFSYLLRQGLDVKAEDNEGANVVHYAMSGGSKTMLKYLAGRGLDYKFMSSRGYSPIMAALMWKQISSIEFLLENGTNINERIPTENFTMLQLACLSGSPEIARFLIDKGADVNLEENNGFTALFWAVTGNNPELTLALLMKGADVNHKTKDGQTPLLSAVDGDSLSMISLLVDKGADVKAADADGKTALHHAAVRGNLQTLTFLIDRGVPVNTKDNNGMTALHYTAVYGYSAMGKILLAKGADPSIMDNKKHDAAWYSYWYGNTDMTRLLAGKGSQAGAGKSSTTALSPDIREGKAVIHFLNHSGFAIETSKHLLVFDYFPNSFSPDKPSLLNGKINPVELKGKKILVFASHEHGDHYDSTIWGWRSQAPGIKYIMGFNPGVKYKYELCEGRSDKTVEGVHIRSIRSTDSGAGFLVEADGVVIYHPGDHVNKDGKLTSDFTSEIDYLAGLKKKVDIAFFPVNGCGFPDAEGVKLGNLYVVKELKPVLCIGMHADVKQCRDFTDLIMKENPGIRTAYGIFPGDRFSYPE
ncbi:MAG: ankyrin repeat domain-containing protein [Bacteroidota bacterium]